MPESELIYIPVDCRGRTFHEFGASVRLKNIVEHRGIRVLGGLHGLPFEEFLKFRNCGARTLRELRGIVASAQSGSTDTVQSGYTGTPSPPNEILVPSNVRHLALVDLPVSRRLEQLFERMRVRQLGEFHGRIPSDLLAYKNCGRTTVKEMQVLILRAAAGEFDHVGYDDAHAPSELLGLLDGALQKLPSQARDLVLDRLGGRGKPPQTLEQIGQRQGVTRERIRQIEAKMAVRLRKTWGPRIPRLLQCLKERCLSLVSPLTPELLTKWLGNDGDNFVLSRPTHVRLIGLLDEGFPCWPDGHDGAGGNDDHTHRFGHDLVQQVADAGGRLPIADAFSRLRHQGMDAADFLKRLRRVRRLAIEFSDPEHPIARLKRVTASYLATQIIGESSEPLTADDVHRRAIERFGTDMVMCEARSLANVLGDAAGVYLLGPGLFGTKKHFQIPPSGWPRVQNEFALLLERENRQISAHEVVSSGLISGLHGIRPHEVASVVREDSRIKDLGYLLFSLAKWGVEERQLIRDLIPEILSKEGRILTAQQLGDKMRRLRSVSPFSIANFAARCPGVRHFGHGFFGLFKWGEDKRIILLLDRTAVENAVRRAELPCRFASLCESLGISPEAPLAVQLWETCEAIPAIVKYPNVRGAGTRLFHESCRLERAMAAALRSLGCAAAPYEVQWALGDLFGTHFSQWAVSDIQRTLRRNPMFIQTADGKFALELDVDELDFDVEVVRARCVELLRESTELLGCDDMIARLEITGQDLNDVAADVLALVLRSSEHIEEIGRNRFRYRK